MQNYCLMIPYLGELIFRNKVAAMQFLPELQKSTEVGKLKTLLLLLFI